MTALPSVRAIADAVNAGAVDPLHFARECLTRIDDAPDLHTVISVASPDQLVPPTRGGRLAGVPVLVKDIIDVAGMATTCGSRYAPTTPTVHAPAVRCLIDDGAVVIGKANLHPYAWGVTSQNPDFGDVVNPRYPRHTPGGSSGGCAAALAADQCAIALGTDTGGSVRMPAACCDVVGYKPPFGTIPLTGARPLARTLDCVGPMARTLDDCLLAAEVLCGVLPDARDQNITVGLVDDVLPHSIFSDRDTTVRSVQFPTPSAQVTALFDYEVAQQHEQRAREHPNAYSPGFHAKLRRLRRISPDSYQAAFRARRAWQADIERGMGCDVIVSPTLGGPIPPRDVWEPSARDVMGRYCRVINYLGWPSLALGNVMISGPRADLVIEVARRVAASPAIAPAVGAAAKTRGSV